LKSKINENEALNKDYIESINLLQNKVAIYNKHQFQDHLSNFLKELDKQKNVQPQINLCDSSELDKI